MICKDNCYLKRRSPTDGLNKINVEASIIQKGESDEEQVRDDEGDDIERS